MAASHAVNYAAALGRSSRLGLVEADRSEPLAPRLAALPRAVVLGAVATMLRCHRICTTDAPCIMMLPLSSHHCHIYAGPLHLYAVVGPVRVASVART